MLNQEYSAKFTIKDIEPKTDRNFNSYYLLHFDQSNYRFGYAFKNTAEKQTWDSLTNSAYRFVNQPVNIVYQLNQTFNSTYLQVKLISLIN